MNRFGYDETRGQVIGAVDTRTHYGFYIDGECIDTTNQENDTAAVEWFKELYPVQFGKGVEMRVFDK